MNACRLIVRSLATLILASAALAADSATSRLTVHVGRDGGAPMAGAAVKVSSGGAVIDLKTDALGNAGCDLKRDALFTATVSAEGYLPCVFTRVLGPAADWGIANVVMSPARLGTSRVAEWRIGRTNPNENPERDFARFNFSVKYYKTGALIGGAKIAISRADGTSFANLTTDANGFATVLVPENTVMKVKVTAAGYNDYATLLAPDQAASSRQVNILLRKSI